MPVLQTRQWLSGNQSFVVMFQLLFRVLVFDLPGGRRNRIYFFTYTPTDTHTYTRIVWLWGLGCTYLSRLSSYWQQFFSHSVICSSPPVTFQRASMCCTKVQQLVWNGRNRFFLSFRNKKQAGMQWLGCICAYINIFPMIHFVCWIYVSLPFPWWEILQIMMCL